MTGILRGVLQYSMAPEAKDPELYLAACAFDLEEVTQLVKAGHRSDRIFLGDQGSTLPQDDPETPAILAQLRQAGREVDNEDQALFELYETLLLSGHPIPDGSSRRCLNRVIAGADADRHARALTLMQLCNEQRMLTWAGSDWAARARETLKDVNPIMRIAMPDEASNELFADAVGQAARAGNLSLLEYLCTHAPEGIAGGRTVFVDHSLPTHKAIEGGSLECLQYLLGIMREDKWQQSTPSTRLRAPLLCAAAYHGKTHIAQWLLDKGVDVDELGGDGRNALAAAADGKAGVEMIRLLLDYGADPNAGRAGPKALHLAVWHQTPEVVKLLLDCGADPNALDNQRSALLLAAMMGAERDVAELLSAGADINAQDEQGKTPVYYACANGRQEAFMLLYVAGADMDIPDNNGQTARDVAHGNIHTFLEQKLLDQVTPFARKDSGKYRF